MTVTIADATLLRVIADRGDRYETLASSECDALENLAKRIEEALGSPSAELGRSDYAMRLNALSWAFARFVEQHTGVLANLSGWDEMSLAFHANCSQEPEALVQRSASAARTTGAPGEPAGSKE